jgi:hypothetical protein
MLIRLLLQGSFGFVAMALLWVPPQVRIPGPGGASGVAPGVGPIAFVNSVCGPATPTANGGTSASVNMSGANFYVAAVAHGTGGSFAITDSNSDTWTPISTAHRIDFAYAQNVTGNSSIAFTSTSSAGDEMFCVYGFSGMATGGVYESVSAYSISGFGTSQPAGSVTPAGSGNQLIFTGMADASGGTPAGLAVSGFLGLQYAASSGGALFGAGGAYLLQNGNAAQSPTWTTTGGGATMAAGAAVFQGN